MNNRVKKKTKKIEDCLLTFGNKFIFCTFFHDFENRSYINNEFEKNEKQTLPM